MYGWGWGEEEVLSVQTNLVIAAEVVMTVPLMASDDIIVPFVS